jgi:hypothetical protein
MLKLQEEDKKPASESDSFKYLQISPDQMAIYKKIYENKKYSNDGFNKVSLSVYLNEQKSMSQNLIIKMTNAWIWEQTKPVSFEIFVKFMYVNYKYEYDGLEYDPDFGKLIKKLDQEQKNINDR